MLSEVTDGDKLAKLREAVENADHALERARIAANEAHFNLAAYNHAPAVIWRTSRGGA